MLTMRIRYYLVVICVSIIAGCSHNTWSLKTEIEKWNSYIDSNKQDRRVSNSSIKLYDPFIQLDYCVNKDVNNIIELNKPFIIMFLNSPPFTYEIIIVSTIGESTRWDFTVWDSLGKMKTLQGSVDLGSIHDWYDKFKLLNNNCEANEGSTDNAVIIAWLYAHNSSYKSALFAPFSGDEKVNVIADLFYKVYSSVKR